MTSTALAPGEDATCPNGGSKFETEAQVTYACNGGVESGNHRGSYTTPAMSGSAAAEQTTWGSVVGSGTMNSAVWTDAAPAMAFVMPAGSTMRNLTFSLLGRPADVLIEVGVKMPYLPGYWWPYISTPSGHEVKCEWSAELPATCATFPDLHFDQAQTVVLHLAVWSLSPWQTEPMTLLYSWDE